MEDKNSSKLVWVRIPPLRDVLADPHNQRGSPTGISMMTQDLPWRDAHRIRLHHFANSHSHNPMAFLVPDLGQDEGDETPEAGRQESNRETGGVLGMKHELAPISETMDFFFDMKLAGAPL